MTATRHVIFGTGAIGLATVNALRRRGESVRLVNRSGHADVPDDVEVIGGDARDPPSPPPSPTAPPWSTKPSTRPPSGPNRALLASRAADTAWLLFKRRHPCPTTTRMLR